MATGTIKNQHKGTWTSVNTNLKYQVRSGIVFVWVQGGGTHSSWTTVGNLPTSVKPDVLVYNTSTTNSSAQSSTYYVGTDGIVQHRGDSAASTIISYPLP